LGFLIPEATLPLSPIGGSQGSLSFLINIDEVKGRVNI
jgi:hypothetical protein